MGRHGLCAGVVLFVCERVTKSWTNHHLSVGGIAATELTIKILPNKGIPAFGSRENVELGNGQKAWPGSACLFFGCCFRSA